MQQKRLTSYERQIIETNLALGKSHREIAKMIGRNHTVVSREIKRNEGQYPPFIHLLLPKRQRIVEPKSLTQENLVRIGD